MNRNSSFVRGAVLATAVSAVLTGAVACSSSKSGASSKSPNASSSTPSTGGSATASLASLLPAAIRSKGALVAGSEIDYPPMEFYPAGGQTPQGLDIDLGNEIAKRLGLKITWVNATFSGLLAGLAARRYDIVMSSMTDTKTREQQADFVDYDTDGLGFVVKPGNPLHITSMDSLCGKTVGAIAGSGNYVDLDKQSEVCAQQGKAKTTLINFPSTDAQFLALQSGRVPIIALGASTADYHVSQQSNLFAMGFTRPGGMSGIAVPKDSTQLAQALKAALQSTINDGTYAAILKKWNAPNLAIKTATIDQPFNE